METTTVTQPARHAPKPPLSAGEGKILLACSRCRWKRTVFPTDRLPWRCPTCGTRLSD
jgi:PHP family Zn ribbon phosphoesterase